MATRSDTPALTMFPDRGAAKVVPQHARGPCLLACCGPCLSEIAAPLLPLNSGDSIDLSGHQRSQVRCEVDETPFIFLGCAGLKSECT